MPGIEGIGPNGRPLGGRFLPQGPLWRKHAGRLERAQNRQKSALMIARRDNSATLGRTPVPNLAPKPPNRDLHCLRQAVWAAADVPGA
ncbi:hypothetical protein ACVWVY_001973 [Bradyrhizobium sp. URHC0002]